MPLDAWDAGAQVQLLIRPEAAQMEEVGPNRLVGVVMERSFRGENYRLVLRHRDGVELTFNFPASVGVPAPGESIVVSLSPGALMLLPCT
jgi:ABC-type Fe3+/spermidine/putrescine transport system ATPase subunit